MAEVVSFVLNHDVAGLHRRINRFVEELQQSASSGLSMVSDHDQTRLQSYLSAIVSYHDWVTDQPQLDLPDTHPRQHNLDPNPPTKEVENESIRDVVTLFELARDELVNSQSARQGSGLVKFDSNRLMGITAKAQAFLDGYIKNTTPLDLPESIPMRERSGEGRTGI